MAAVRYTSTYKSDLNDEFVIQIWDTEGGGSTIFDESESGFTISYQSNRTDLFPTLLGTECSVDVWVEDENLDALITDITNSQEGRFFLRILKFGIQDWVGMVLPDIGSYDEDHYPYRFTIRATDGLGTLKGKPFWNRALESAWEGKISFLDAIILCLKEIRSVEITDFWDSNAVLIRSAVDWWETTMTNSPSGSDALKFAYFEHSVFYRWEKGEKVYQDCYTVLLNILTEMGAHMSMKLGAFWIIQPTYATTSTVILRRYNRSGGLITTQNFTQDHVIDQTEDGALIFGAQYEFLPALRDHRHTFKSFMRRNFFAGLESKAVMGDQAQYFPIPLESNGGKTTLRFTGSLKLIISSKFPDNTGASAFEPFVAVFNLQLFLKTKGLVRTADILPTYQIAYGNLQWGNSPGMVVGVPLSGGAFLSNRYGDAYTYVQQIDIFTPPLPESTESFTFFYDLNALYRYDGGGVYAQSNFNIDYEIEGAWLEAYSEGGPVRLSDEYVYEAVNDPKNSVRTETEALIGTHSDPNVLGAIWVKPGANFQLATNWGAGLAARTKPIESLICEYIVSGRTTPNRRLSGTVYGNIGSHFRLNWIGATWMFVGGEWESASNELRGEWEEQVYATPPSVSPPKPKILPDTPVPVPEQEDNNGAERIFKVNELPTGTHFFPLAAGKTTQAYEEGSISTLHLAVALNRNDFRSGEKIALMNPTTGWWDELTVASSATEGATTLSVSGSLRFWVPKNATILKPPIVNIATALDQFPYYTSDEDAVAGGLAVGDWYIADEGHTGAQPGTLKKVMQVVLP